MPTETGSKAAPDCTLPGLLASAYPRQRATTPVCGLLEDLLSGPNTCWLIFDEHAELPDNEEEQDEADDAWQAEQQDTFVDLARAATTAKYDRLL
ncbi:hypothetical protein ACJ6WF_31360 [Streptomyces sp. MMS24-I2-30]|uniref:hypothetical protein n=1 Tax=Streptomyces sp. MMS24-I2-30 TaxID=3351564 RepID=UPI003896AC25